MKIIKIETLQDLENFINQPRPQEEVRLDLSEEILLLLAGYAEALPFEISLTPPPKLIEPLIIKGYTSSQ